MHVLIVEDDSALGHFLGDGLTLDGHEVSWVADGDQALASVAKLRSELMILDLGLPRKDGMEVLAEMGARFRSTSVLVLTARAGMEERVKCLELGADDVMLKPFSLFELRARLKALGRRRSQWEETVLRFGDMEMDRAERRVMHAGHEVELTATEFLLLEALLRRRGEHVCSRKELLHEVWRDHTGIGTNIVEVYVNYLRRKLGGTFGRSFGAEKGDSACFIRTVRGEGYVLDVGNAGAPGSGLEAVAMNVEGVRGA